MTPFRETITHRLISQIYTIIAVHCHSGHRSGLSKANDEFLRKHPGWHPKRGSVSGWKEQTKAKGLRFRRTKWKSVILRNDLTLIVRGGDIRRYFTRINSEWVNTHPSMMFSGGWLLSLDVATTTSAPKELREESIIFGQDSSVTHTTTIVISVFLQKISVSTMLYNNWFRWRV